jgi:hypothetical protein
MKTNTPTPTKNNDRKISQAESQILVDWLRQNGYDVKNAASLWKLRPSAVARSFKLKHEDVLVAIRRVESEEEEG